MFTSPVRTASAKRSPSITSPVKIAASRPYGEALVSSMACSSDRTGTTGAIGPKVSSRAARDDTGAAIDRVGDVRVHLRRHGLVVERPHRRLGRERIPQPHALLDL